MEFTTKRTVIRNDWQLGITADMVLQRQGASPAKVRIRKPLLLAIAERAIAEGEPWVRPQVAYRTLQIQKVTPDALLLSQEARLTGATISRKFSQCNYLVLAIATIGSELERHCLRLAGTEPSFALALDGYGTACVGALTLAMRSYFSDLAKQVRLGATSPSYPGANDWELAAAQQELFSLVDGAAIGVSLTPSFLMTPCKSVSMAIGIGARQESVAEPCQECGAAATCRHRQLQS